MSHTTKTRPADLIENKTSSNPLSFLNFADMKSLPDQLRNLANSIEELIDAVESMVPIIEKATTSFKKTSTPKQEEEKILDRNAEEDNKKDKNIQEILNNPLVKNILSSLNQNRL